MSHDPVARLLDERACERLIIDYTHLVDFGEAARIADLFMTDGVWEAGGLRMDGQDAIRARASWRVRGGRGPRRDTSRATS
jgi:SnoaL-like domain